jgi:hypothetical protein
MLPQICRLIVIAVYPIVDDAYHTLRRASFNEAEFARLEKARPLILLSSFMECL